MGRTRLLIIEVAALGHDLAQEHAEALRCVPWPVRPLTPVFPAVTCTSQASFRTGQPPAGHGVVCNGFYDPAFRRTDFWSQSAALLPPARIWDGYRRRGGTVGVLFWQQSLGDSTDLVLSPAPVHKHHGGMIQDCYGQPPDLYARLCGTIGRPFDLMRYWGPLAGLGSTRWIVDATLAVLRDSTLAPGVLLTYLPHLDYALQKYGPADGRRIGVAVAELGRELGRLLDGAAGQGCDVLVWGDYAIAAATRPVYPNRALREAGLFHARHVGRRTYPDLHASEAFAMVDHQVAHVYLRSPQATATARACLAAVPGVDAVLDHAAMDHPRAGHLVLMAAPGAWFAYPWWTDRREAPDYASHIDIHSKPGFDPCELFWGWPPPSVSLDATRVRGTHGRTDRPVALATSLDLGPAPADHAGLGRRLREYLDPLPVD